MVTLKDVGELAGVTATTASAALRGKDYVKPETTQRVRDAARKLGYKINLSGRSLRSGRSDTITFLTSGIEGDYFSQLAMCVAEEVHKRGSHMLIELSRYLIAISTIPTSFPAHVIFVCGPPRRRFSRPDCRLTSAAISSNPRGRLTAVSRPGAAWLRKASASMTDCTA